MKKENEYVSYLQRVCPELQIRSAYINEIGQNNDVLIVNDNVVFRFPKYEKGIQKLRRELASYGEEFLQLFSAHYPNLEAVKERMYFYKSTFSLQEALFGVLNNDKKAFEAGLAQYV
ncbi:hypothetical protein EC917_106113 [Bacillus thuringiensis]|uniref:Uncharacterized protein n=1 Tax=Bacillus thuringiensis TaxID=1428 RepID=A0A4R4BG47_BACTU|nr:hypothetical protein [Bacillus thuringiensis]TCW55258.1 hypothetical protein EC917_106113 [Bacillus thuringiensis]TCW55529.1 hypothetical protein EC910_106140 [Bacillus thuringiensis]